MLPRMVAVRVGNKGQPLRHPRIHPQVDRRHQHPAAIRHLNHVGILPEGHGTPWPSP